jgi:hypothetical protein
MMLPCTTSILSVFVRVYWDIYRYSRISSDMVGYDKVCWDISGHGMISPDMVGYDNM